MSNTYSCLERLSPFIQLIWLCCGLEHLAYLYKVDFNSPYPILSRVWCAQASAGHALPKSLRFTPEAFPSSYLALKEEMATPRYSLGSPQRTTSLGTSYQPCGSAEANRLKLGWRQRSRISLTTFQNSSPSTTSNSPSLLLPETPRHSVLALDVVCKVG